MEDKIIFRAHQLAEYVAFFYDANEDEVYNAILDTLTKFKKN